MNPCIKIAFFLILTSLTTGCDTGYWWSRGQPSGVSELIQRSSERLAESVATHGPARENLSGIAVHTSKALEKALQNIGSGAGGNQLVQLSSELKIARDSFMKMEGLISIGSRAAFSELSGQLRKFTNSAKEGQAVNPEAFGLFHARTQFFLARELMVPPPNFG